MNYHSTPSDSFAPLQLREKSLPCVYLPRSICILRFAFCNIPCPLTEQLKTAPPIAPIPVPRSPTPYHLAMARLLPPPGNELQ
jgi:hypothetical protein